jgi:hypothetical protein
VYEQSYIKRAGQLWKLYVGMAGVLFGGILIWFGRSRIEAAPDTAIPIIVAGTAVGLTSMVWSAIAVRCPKCGTRLLWRAVSEESSANWLTWLLHLDACPSCGTRSEEAAAER